MQSSEQRRRRILFVEDAPEFARRMVAMLEESAAVVVLGPVSNGSDALRVFQETLPDGVLLDLQLPGKNGLEVLAGIRTTGHPCLVVILTSHATPEFRERCLLAGADYFFGKSHEFESAVQAIGQFAETGARPSLA